nr:ribonuclease H-like domain-containing protein [Tanacetum cinerariifolium]
MYRASNLDSIKIITKELEEKDLSWTGLPEFVDDTVTDYSRPSPTVVSTSAEGQNKDSSTTEDVASPNPPKPFVKPKDSQPESKPHGAPIRPPLSSSGHRPHGGSLRPPYRSAGHRPHGLSMNPRRPTMNGARPYKSFFIQSPSYETRPFLKSAAVKTPYIAPWVPTINRAVIRTTLMIKVIRTVAALAMKMATLYVLPLLALPFLLVVLILPQSIKTLLVPILLLSPMVLRLNLRTFEDINQIDKDDMEEIDIKWNMALLSMRADKFWKRTGKKISIQGLDVAGFDKSKVECFNYHKMGHFARECRAPRSQKKEGKKAIDKGLKLKKRAPTEFALMANIENKLWHNLEEVKLEKDGLDGKLAGLLKASKNLDHLIESQRFDQTGLLEFVDDTVTDYSMPSPTVVSTSAEGQNKNSSTSEDVASPNPPKPFVKFVKPKDSEPESKSKEQETPKKSQVKYAEQYRHSNKRPKGNQRNWNNLKSY